MHGQAWMDDRWRREDGWRYGRLYAWWNGRLHGWWYGRLQGRDIHDMALAGTDMAVVKPRMAWRWMGCGCLAAFGWKD